ncbi:hypothetical protein [Legionella oakridgensis]|uniref:Integral membrane protein (PIN domain superfamily) n=2 Tax=Legionella oakridgensis TaxID=29423 RepID=W0BAS5_9GAMM|nr:hypothetical protein [Legionella oakridgensis]AHE66950.1 hypothetical protein Loa_01397 [Legionella oakridgensis ATCC 33761 = DSM 21215]ETO93405.1 hypothetical protein LOR_60c14260 [Legionella oakridgensis RV-2-2007]KTD39518.1 Integral membrane protein (PIN domain superfamily) [Legionella oakridgensis]STY20056.1 Integral membrane protein (PIN domain superfamily) [Legionella longbeachae]
MISIFLATVIGWYLVITSLLLIFKHELVRPVMSEIMTHRALLFILAIITLILGLLLVTSHNIWVMGWPVIITLFAWLILLSGIVRLFFPDVAAKMGQSFLERPARMIVAGVVFLVIGIFLLFKVYFG